MHRLRTLFTLLTPSLLSGIVTLCAVFGVVVVSGWSYIAHNNLFYDYLFGPYGIQNILLQAPDPFALFKNTVATNPATYYVILFFTALMIGLFVYALLQSLSRVSRAARTIVQELKLPDERRDMLQRTAVRTAALAGWAAYTALFLNVLLTTSILLLELGVSNFAGSQLAGVVYFTGACVLLGVGLHVHIVFARLTTLKSRIFGERLAMDD